jgi:hypothetical protein
MSQLNVNCPTYNCTADCLTANLAVANSGGPIDAIYTTVITNFCSASPCGSYTCTAAVCYTVNNCIGKGIYKQICYDFCDANPCGNYATGKTCSTAEIQGANGCAAVLNGYSNECMTDCTGKTCGYVWICGYTNCQNIKCTSTIIESNYTTSCNNWCVGLICPATNYDCQTYCNSANCSTVIFPYSFICITTWCNDSTKYCKNYSCSSTDCESLNANNCANLNGTDVTDCQTLCTTATGTTCPTYTCTVCRRRLRMLTDDGETQDKRILIQAGTNQLGAISNTYWTGIKRPTIDSFINFNVNDYLAFFCSSALNTDNIVLTNYVSNISAFVLDYNPDLVANWGAPSLGFDKGEQAVKSDIASNIRINLATPTIVPYGTSLYIGAASNGFTANTICGIQTSTSKIVRECTSSNQKIICNTDKGVEFTICCYNVFMSDPFALSSLTAVFNTNSPGYLSTLMYSSANQIASGQYQFISGVSSSTAASMADPNYFAFISFVKYTQVNQEGGYGKAIISVSLPREPARDMRFTFVGDYSFMLIPGNTPRCVASLSSPYGANWDGGDALIESCSTSSFSNSSNAIVITTKKLVYKCGISFSRTLVVSLWPVVASAFGSNTNYRVLMQLNSGDNIINNTVDFKIPQVKPLDTKPTASPQLDTLCPVTVVNPRIPGEYSDYTFDFDFDTNKSDLASGSPNEVSIFWPYNLYGATQDVSCSYNQASLNCYFSDDGILNIRFENMPIGSGRKISIVVSSVLNPIIDSDITFPCTINNTNNWTQERINIVVGSGKLTGGINIPQSGSLGALRFSSTKNTLSNSNPRTNPSQTLRITFDRAENLTTLPLTLTDPIVMITFPKEYNLKLYPSVKPNASIQPYTSKDTSIISGDVITPASIIQQDNRIFLYLPSGLYKFESIFLYWDIKFKNIAGPSDVTNVGAFKVLIYNSQYSQVFRTYTNLNNQAYDKLLPKAEDGYLAYYRGFSFDFDNKLWIVDINTQNVLNSLILKPGRYTTSSFNVRNGNIYTNQPSSAVISLSDKIFTTALPDYTLYSNAIELVPFTIGIPCGVGPGNYVINFDLKVPSFVPDDWAPMAPVLVKIDWSAKGIISYQTPSFIPQAGSTWIGTVLSEINFDVLKITWKDAPTSTNDPTAKMEGTTIPANTDFSTIIGQSPYRSTFSITNYDNINSQSYITNDPNECFTWSVNTISININGQTAIIPQDYNIVPAFSFYNYDTDKTLPSLNSIKFNIKFPYAPIYIYCALVCINATFPSDDVIKTSIGPNSQIQQLYSGVFTEKSGQDIIYKGLIRGQRYKMECIIESVQGEKTLRTSTSGIIDKYVMLNETLDIMPTYPQPTYCAQFLFYNDPGQETKVSIIQYCQRLFTTSGWTNNGCIVCTDSSLSYIIPGVKLPKENVCLAPSKNLRNLQETLNPNPDLSGNTNNNNQGNSTNTPSGNPTPTNVNDTVIPVTVTENKTILFSVCAIASPACESNVSGNRLYTDIFKQLTADLGSQNQIKTTLNIINAQVNTINTYDDTTNPDLTNVRVTVTGNLISTATLTATSPIPIKCYFQLTTAASAPTFDDIQSCTTNMCGIIKPSQYGHTVNVALDNIQTGMINIFIGCSNDIPYSQKRTQVVAINTFNTVVGDKAIVSNNSTCGNGNETCIGSDFFEMKFMLYVLLLLLI